MGKIGSAMPIDLLPQYHPVNYILLGIFTVSLAFAVGLTCAFTNGKVILESVILTTVAVVSPSLYNFLGPLPFGALILLVFGTIQFFFPPGKTSIMVDLG